ncbi:MFS transporter [Puniceibacterium confluentis]|uniref:MFS transporter n=1 Tax=Puniceibacterium confluentis TaxID=1958944 RepID=UPI0011B811B5|nr:MFS transporter [Puniceibacterium confluentis]
MTTTRPERLTAYAVFAAVLSAAGLPIYIHAPKFYVDSYGVSLTSLGAVLFALRLIDVVQDPLLGRLAAVLRRWQGAAAAVAVALMVGGMLGLFVVAPPVSPIWWFAAMLTLVFSAFSFLTIIFYARGVAKAVELDPSGAGHLRLARWRECGGLLGVCVASILPAVFLALGWKPFAGFALVFAAVAVLAAMMMRAEWSKGMSRVPSGFAPVLRDTTARRLLLVALANAAPVAVTSSLFLFYVESRLDAPGWQGPLLLMFFVAAAVAAPLWGLLAERIGAKRVLMSAMVLSVLAFSLVLLLREGDTWAFAAICLASGAALGADMTVLPALFARRMAKIAPNAAEGFALWSFVSKFTLAFAALALLPTLEAAGFTSGIRNSENALWTLTLLYALVPCALKLVALSLLCATRLEE